MAISRTPSSDVERRLLPLPAAATMLSVGLRTLRTIIATGAIPVVRVSPRRVAIDLRDLTAYIDARRS
jgi:hypothetical protein